MSKIGIIGAEKQEITLLKKHFSGNSIKIAGLTFYDGEINEKSVCLVCAGIGKVNAAMCTQILISEFKVSSVINTGTAGSLDNALNIFDIVVSVDAVQHDVDATNFGYDLGQVPQTKSAFWKANSSLAKKAVSAFKAMQKNDEKMTSAKIVSGRIASGDVFVADKKRRNFIAKTFSAQCTEMEGASIAQVCVLNKVPFVILRSISDKAGAKEPAKISYEEFSKKASYTASLLVLEMLKSF